MTILRQTASLNPGEGKVVSFTFTPSEARRYQVTVNGLTGSFATVRTTPSELLIDYQKTLEDAIRKCEAGSTAWVNIPDYGLQYPCPAIPQLKELMIEEAINIGMISSANECYFVGAIMYHISEDTIVPYWWPCPYCGEQFRSPEDRDTHMQTCPYITKGTIIGIDPILGYHEITGIIVTWRNDSPHPIRGHVDVLGTHVHWGAPFRVLTATYNQDLWANLGQSIPVYFSYPSAGQEYVRVKATLKAEGRVLDEMSATFDFEED